MVAKVLRSVSSLGVVAGTRGPDGGSWLQRPQKKISLLDSVEVFVRSDAQIMCPFGPNWCGNGERCLMNDSLLRMDQQWMAYLREISLSVFPKKAVNSSASSGSSAYDEFEAGEG